MNISKIALSILITTCAAPVFATDLRSYQLADYNCEESSAIEVKACLETTLAESLAKLSESEHYFNKSVDDINLDQDSTTTLKKSFEEEKMAYKNYAETQCNFKIAIESKQNPNADIERLALICQINTIDSRIEGLTEFTHDLTNDFVASKSAESVSSDTPIVPFVEENTETVQEAPINEVTEQTPVVDEDFTKSVQSAEEVVPITNNETDVEDDLN